MIRHTLCDILSMLALLSTFTFVYLMWRFYNTFYMLPLLVGYSLSYGLALAGEDWKPLDLARYRNAK